MGFWVCVLVALYTLPPSQLRGADDPRLCSVNLSPQLKVYCASPPISNELASQLAACRREERGQLPREIPRPERERKGWREVEKENTKPLFQALPSFNL